MRGCEAYWSACTSSARVTPCSSAMGASASIESGVIEICTRAIGKPSFAAALICSVMYSMSSSWVEQAIAVDADVGVDGERGRDESDLGDEVAEPAGERVVDRREAAEAREPDDLEARAVALGGDLADEALEVVLAAVEGAGEAVERDALDRGAERRVMPPPPSWSWCRALRCAARLGVGDDDVGDVEREVDARPRARHRLPTGMSPDSTAESMGNHHSSVFVAQLVEA